MQANRTHVAGNKKANKQKTKASGTKRHHQKTKVLETITEKVVPVETTPTLAVTKRPPRPAHKHREIDPARVMQSMPTQVASLGDPSAVAAAKYIAACYGVRDSPPARYPDVSPYPTAVARDQSDLKFPVVTQAGVNADKFIIFAVCAQLKNCYQYATAIDASGTITWALADSALVNEFVTDMWKYRIIGLRTGVNDFAPANYRGGIIKKGLITMVKNGWGVPQTLQDIDSMTTLHVVDEAGPDLQDRSSQIWVPAGDEAFLWKDLTYSAGSLDSTGFSSLFYSIRFPFGNTFSPTFDLTVSVNLEWIPYGFVSDKYDLISVVGDPGMVGRILAVATSGENQFTLNRPSDWSLGGLWETISGGLKKAFNFAGDVVGTVEKVATVGRSIFDKVTPFLGMLGDRREIADHLRACADYIIACEDQARRMHLPPDHKEWLDPSDLLADGPEALRLKSPFSRFTMKTSQQHFVVSQPARSRNRQVVLGPPRPPRSGEVFLDDDDDIDPVVLPATKTVVTQRAPRS